MAYKLSRELSCATKWNTKNDLLNNLVVQPLFCEFYRFINVKFKDPNLLAQALCHSSFAYGKRENGIEDNERLEFLGDSEFGSYVTSRLYEKFPNMSEGELSKFRAALISEESLNEIGALLNLSNLLLVGRNLAGQNYKPSPGIVSSAFEAIVGAIIKDQGVEKGRLLLDELFYRIKYQFGIYFWDLKKLHEFDAKTRLQEETVRHLKETPQYESRKLDNQTFEVALKFRDQILLTTQDVSKKKAERKLAQRALLEKLYLMYVPLDDKTATDIVMADIQNNAS